MNTQLNNALKPCPCCGCHNPKFTSDDFHHFRHTIKCQDCPLLAEFYSSTRDQAIAAWNRRANTPDSAAQGAMGEGYRFGKQDIQMTQFALSLLKNNPWPTSDTRWRMVETWLSDLSRLAQPSASTTVMQDEVSK